jgi:hypothetical protein
MDILSELQNNKTIFFSFMREKYPVFESSNLFLRDLQYAIMSYFGKKDIKVKYGRAEKIAFQFAESLEKQNDLTRVNEVTWKVNFSPETGVRDIKAVEIQN